MIDRTNVDLRKTSEQEWFPWLGGTVTLLRIGHDGITQAKPKRQKIDMLQAAADGDIVLACWPGKWSQDVFLVDDVPAAAAAIQG